MSGTIGACGHTFSGSGAVLDLLREFDDAQVLGDVEFIFPYFPDGLRDLEFHIGSYHKYFASAVAISRFRRLMKWHFLKHSGLSPKTLNNITERYLSKIIQTSWYGRGFIGRLTQPVVKTWFGYAIMAFFKYILRFRKVPKFFERFIVYKIDYSAVPDNLDTASREFISEILDNMGRNKQKITVLDQPFIGCNPVPSFKYFDNPKAIMVVRDPRDHYLFAKKYLRPTGKGYFIPCDTVDEYITNYKLIRRLPEGLDKRGDFMLIHFEELIYDYENAVKRIADFSGVTDHTCKGKYFNPSRSRNNTQLFKKYSGFEEDIAKIERELPEFLFHFESYPDIEAEGKMFY